MDPQTTAPPLPRRLRKRVIIPGLLLAVLLLLAGWVWVRGTWADGEARNPASAAEGTITQLYVTGDGHKQVRCARVLDYPIEAVWAVVTDYDHFAEMFPHLAFCKSEHSGGNEYRVWGTVTTPVGDWNFQTWVQHRQTPRQDLATWDEPGGHLTVERGSWLLTKLDDNRTLLVYAQEVEVARCPAFLVRAVMRHELPKVVAAVAERLEQGGR